VLGLVIPIAIVVGVLVAISVTARRPDLVEVSIDDRFLVVQPLGAMQLWSMKRRLRVPLAWVRAARVADGTSLVFGLRMPGVALPGVLAAGSYGFGKNRSFWIVRRRRGPKVVIELDEGGYSMIVLEVPDPETVVRRIADARGGAPRPQAT
jgi:hypothetical protein